MRDFSKVSPRFWTGETGRAIRAKGDDALIVAMYLMSAPGSNMIGMYYLALPTLAHETGRSLEGAMEALRSLAELDFAHYDEAREVVWVTEMACHQIGKTLKPTDNQHSGVINQLAEHSKCAHAQRFWERYAEPFKLPESARPSPQPPPGKHLRRPLEAPPPQEQEQEQEQEKERETEKEKEVLGDPPSARVLRLAAGAPEEPKTRKPPADVALCIRTTANASGGRLHAGDPADWPREAIIAVHRLKKRHPIEKWKLVGEWLEAGGLIRLTDLGVSFMATTQFAEAFAHAESWDRNGRGLIGGRVTKPDPTRGMQPAAPSSSFAEANRTGKAIGSAPFGGGGRL